jgi:transcription antitermination protein NusB
MSSRRRARSYALQALYQADLAAVPVAGALEALWTSMIDGEGIENTHPPEAEEVEFARALALGVDGTREAIDQLIETCSTNWRISRMPVIDRNILRMGAYELMTFQDVPANVIINEAVELAKRYGTAESRAFVNGIVDRMARQLDRITREERKRSDNGE